ncbi:hypothetical protein BAE44_0026254 [Dichanthelium oligosanthes]|uniref:DUF674 domain-containing protein n=1 Tax=Dichanthelium oligosanthes TaxID=888268 RepID=A0A1E5UIM3_9POAL|nr:hypothetical protein BAE44_0026254 [Dichanthelium oligosanthes]
MSTTTSTLKMKLLIDTKAKHVLFAEADKDVVDFLFSLLALPVATIVKMLGKSSLSGSFGNIYGSVEKLDHTYVLPDAKKEALLQPTVVPSPASTSRTSPLLPALSSGQPKSFFRCGYLTFSSCYNYVTDTRGTKCPGCSNKMSVAVKFVPPEADGSGHNVQMASSTDTAKGFVQGVVTYTVRDDLTVTPMSAISSMTMLNNAAVTDFSALQEKTVQLGYTEGLEIVKASLQSKTVLTDVFLGKKRPRACA